MTTHYRIGNVRFGVRLGGFFALWAALFTSAVLRAEFRIWNVPLLPGSAPIPMVGEFVSQEGENVKLRSLEDTLFTVEAKKLSTADQQYLYSIKRGLVKPSELPTGPAVAIVVDKQFRGPVRLVAFGSDGDSLVTWTAAAKRGLLVSAWNAQTGQNRNLYKNTSEDALRPAFIGNDAATFVSVTSAAESILCDATNGLEIQKLPTVDGLKYYQAFSAQLERGISSSLTEGAVVWDNSNGRILHHLATQKVHRAVRGWGSTDSAVLAALSPDGAYAVTALFSNTAALWNLTSGKTEYVFQAPAMIQSLSFSADGKRLLAACGTKDGDLSFHFRKTDPQTSKDPTNPYRTYVPTNGSVAVLWDVAKRSRLQLFKGHTQVVLKACFSPDGERIMTASQDGSAILWDVPSGRPLQRFKATARNITVQLDSARRPFYVSDGVGAQPLNDAAFSPDGATIATASDDGSCYLWNVTTGALRARLAYLPDDRGDHWLAQTKEGYFTGSARLADIATLSTGVSKKSFAELPELVRPDLVEKAVREK